MRRTGFSRPEYTRPAREPLRPLTRVVNVARIEVEASPQPKTEQHRCPNLLAMARDRRCLLAVPRICTGGFNTTVACHSNLPEHGKAGARKADDEYSVWGCFGCHTWLDQGKAPAAKKRLAFTLAHLDQVIEWRRIATDPSEKRKDRIAAAWALTQLNARPAP